MAPAPPLRGAGASAPARHDPGRVPRALRSCAVMRRLFPRGYLFTVVGIAVGVAGLVALGAMAERITRFIQGGDRFVTGQISVAGAGIGMGAGFTGGGLLSSAKIAEIQQVPGVEGVQAQVMLPFNPSVSQFLTMTQELVLGVDVAMPSPNRHYREMPVARGRYLRPGDRRAAVLGADFAASRRLDVGGALSLGGAEFTVVGVLGKMLTAPDRFAIVTIEDGRELWLRRDPMLVQVFGSGAGGLGRRDLNSGAAVGWRDGEDPDAVARRIQAQVKGVNVTIPSELSQTLRMSTAFFSSLLLGIGTLGLVIGGLSLSNTVAASVFERIRDFGIKRALGATDLQLLGEVLREALAVSVAGGGLGVLLALAVGSAVDWRLVRDGQQLFFFSARLLAFTAVFALLLGAMAAIYATLRIARLSPAEAVRRGT
jgi:putative ABC transport system permease protein